MQERRSYLADVIRALIGMPVCREMPGPRKGAVLEHPDGEAYSDSKPLILYMLLDARESRRWWMTRRRGLSGRPRPVRC